jgi:hypothetical protein
LTGRLDLDSPRPAAVLIGDSLRLYGRHFRTFVAIGVAVVLPAELIVSGVGLRELTAPFGAERPFLARQIPEVVRLLVTVPLISAAVVHVLDALSRGGRPSARRALVGAVEVFRHVFVALLPAFACDLVLLLAVAFAGDRAFVPLLLVPLALALRWYVAPQAVVAGGERRLAALRASWGLTRGAWLKVAAVALASYALFTFAAALAASPLLSLAHSADSGALVVAFGVVSQSLATPAIAIAAALLYFDLRSRAL